MTIYLPESAVFDGTYLKVDGVTVFDGSLGTGYTADGCTVSGFIKGDIKFFSNF